MTRETFVTLVTDDAYCIGALVLGASLKRTGTTRELTVLFTSKVSESMRPLLSKYFDNAIIVDSLYDAEFLQYFKTPDLESGYEKLYCWKLTQFSKGVFMDADTVVLRNIDDLFEREELSAVPDSSWPDLFNDGVFVFRPSLLTFYALKRLAGNKHSYDGTVQGLLNTYFDNWLGRGIQYRLSYKYSCACQISEDCGFEFYTSAPAWVQYGGSVCVAHFIGPVKPWDRASGARRCQHAAYVALLGSKSDRLMVSRTASMLAYWWSVFLLLVRPELSSEMYLGNFELDPPPPPPPVHYPSHEEHRRRDYNMQQTSGYNQSSPSAAYCPSFTNAPQPAPPPMIPYHPEFHETRWDYLHSGQRVDEANRFSEQHHYRPPSPPHPPPRPHYTPLQPQSYSPPKQQTPTPPPSHPHHQQPAYPEKPAPDTSHTVLHFSQPTIEEIRHEQERRKREEVHYPPEPVLEVPKLPVQVTEASTPPQPVDISLPVPKPEHSIWNPEEEKENKPKVVYCLTCQKCKEELSKQKVVDNAPAKGHRLDTSRSISRKLLPPKTRRHERRIISRIRPTPQLDKELIHFQAVRSKLAGKSVSGETGDSKTTERDNGIAQKVEDGYCVREVIKQPSVSHDVSFTEERPNRLYAALDLASTQRMATESLPQHSEVQRRVRKITELGRTHPSKPTKPLSHKSVEERRSGLCVALDLAFPEAQAERPQSQGLQVRAGGISGTTGHQSWPSLPVERKYGRNLPLALNLATDERKQGRLPLETIKTDQITSNQIEALDLLSVARPTIGTKNRVTRTFKKKRELVEELDLSEVDPAKRHLVLTKADLSKVCARVPLSENTPSQRFFPSTTAKTKPLVATPQPTIPEPLERSELDTGAILFRSRPRTMRELRRAREKLKERKFDKQAAAATWEDAQQIKEISRKILMRRSNKLATAIKQVGTGESVRLVNLHDRLCERHEKLDTERLYAWERGEIDYTGADRFANILAKICDTMARAGEDSNMPVGLD
ncbi:unnamed protein product [Calicophoron daubneyi]|uniref:glycogenin glucosyltransferase n=1 Tax=Calicophoron daubneyi TaxID=300641 RepID=A0AAV2SXH5_CALDB